MRLHEFYKTCSSAHVVKITNLSTNIWEMSEQKVLDPTKISGNQRKWFGGVISYE